MNKIGRINYVLFYVGVELDLRRETGFRINAEENVHT
jgi:hypothetical protein